MIVRFVQRWALFFALLVGGLAYRFLLPNDAPMWLEIAVYVSVTLVVYLLLYKDGVTGNRPRKNKSDFR